MKKTMVILTIITFAQIAAAISLHDFTGKLEENESTAGVTIINPKAVVKMDGELIAIALQSSFYRNAPKGWEDLGMMTAMGLCTKIGRTYLRHSPRPVGAAPVAIINRSGEVSISASTLEMAHVECGPKKQ